MTTYAAGLRVSEVCRLQVPDIDSGRMCLRIDQSKGQKDRYVPLSPRLLEQLRAYYRRERPERWVFPGHPADRAMSRAGPAHIYHLAKDKARIRRNDKHTLAGCVPAGAGVNTYRKTRGEVNQKRGLSRSTEVVLT